MSDPLSDPGVPDPGVPDPRVVDLGVQRRRLELIVAVLGRRVYARRIDCGDRFLLIEGAVCHDGLWLSTGAVLGPGLLVCDPIHMQDWDPLVVVDLRTARRVDPAGLTAPL